MKPEGTHTCHAKQWPTPPSIFFGILYIPFYAWIAAPLFNLLKKNNKWEWTKIYTEAFELCKQVLINAPV
jgi:hypothetical protein